MRSRGRNIRALVAVLAAFVALPAAAADARFQLVVNGTETGYISLGGFGSASDTEPVLGERVDGRVVPIAPLPLQPLGTPSGASEPVVGGNLERIERWRCDRVVREFVLTWKAADGTPGEDAYTLRTPSCSNRLRLSVPTEVKPGRSFLVTVNDSWTTGDVKPKLCLRRPRAGRVACRTLTIAAGKRSAAAKVSAGRTKGRWRVELQGTGQRLRAVVSVGVKPRPQDVARLPDVLITGDSMMQSVDAELQDRLTGLAEAHSDVRLGSGFTRKVVVDWAKLPTKQVREFKPKATIVFLGANDGLPQTLPDGREVVCCGEEWIDEYARRAAAAMETYLRSGRLFWLTMPAPRDPKRADLVAAVNVAVRRAAQRVPKARLVDMAEVFTPGGTFRETMTYRGRAVRVRHADGVHLSVAGSEIAATIILDELEKAGLL